MLKIPKPTISLSETLERFNKLKPKKINLEDLQSEVSQVKKEIQQLKDINIKLEDLFLNLIKNSNLLIIVILLLKMINLNLLTKE